MARQSGLIKLKGTLGDLSFYKTSDGHYARVKGGVDGNKIANDPAFQRTRENGLEFGRAGKGGKLIRQTIRVLLQQVKDKRMVGRLTKALLAVVKTDPINGRGDRTIQDGNMGLLTKFEFNQNGTFRYIFKPSFTTTFDRVTGDAGLTIVPFDPRLSIVAPSGTSHFKFVMGAAELDFPNETSVFESAETAILPFEEDATTTIDLTVTVTPESVLPVIQVVGVVFYQEVNGQMYPLKNGASNALVVTTVDTV